MWGPVVVGGDFSWMMRRHGVKVGSQGLHNVEEVALVVGGGVGSDMGP